MSDASEVAAFGDALRAALTRFQAEERVIRAEYASRVRPGHAAAPFDEALLERPTRRFLIDPMLRALDWDPDDPASVAEEARAWTANGERLYFDYLGVSRRGQPTLLVEAKGADAPRFRPPRVQNVSATQMAVLLSQALFKLKAGESPGVLAEWVEWLRELSAYVRSLDSAGRLALKRVVITAGRWLIVFRYPVAAFIEPGEPDAGEIHCYVSVEELVDRHEEIYRLLARRRLIDTLPVTMYLGEALQIVDPSSVSRVFRGVVVATRMSGAIRGQFPTRVVYPALVLLSGGRMFAVVDYDSPPQAEPLDAADMAAFLADIGRRAAAFVHRALTAFNRTELSPSSSAEFPLGVREPIVGSAFAPEPGSTAALAPAAPARPQLVRGTGERRAQHEFLVITGQPAFYKAEVPAGPDCGFHSHAFAAKRGVAGEGRFKRLAGCFTVSADPQNCEHGDLLGARRARCHVAAIESHLCCWTCIFREVCWTAEERARLPCGTM